MKDAARDIGQDATPGRSIRILLVDDHPILMEGLQTLIDRQPDMQVVAMLTTGRAAVDEVQIWRPDVILMDIQMEGLNGLEATRQILQEYPKTAVIILTQSAAPAHIRAAFAAGAQGYLLKNARIHNVLDGIRQVANGGSVIDPAVQSIVIQQFHSGQPVETRADARDALTSRELDVIRAVVAGHSNKEIGAQVGLAERTVAKAITSILQKLELRDRTQLAVYATQQLISPPPVVSAALYFE